MMSPIMLDAPCDASCHVGHPPSCQMPLCHDGGIIYHCKTHANIDIYPCGFFFENIGHKYDFEVGWSGVGWVDPAWVWGWSSSKEKNLTK